MDLLYHIIIGIGILAVSPYILLRAAVDGAFRAEVFRRLEGGADLPRLGGCVWIHAASAGEVKAAKIIISALKARNHSVVLSTFTRTGFDLARAENISPAFQLPPDFPFWLEPLFQKLNPQCLILLEGEFWPSLLRICNRRGIPVILVNGRMSEKSFNSYNFVKPLFRWITAGIKLFSMRAETDADRLRKLGVPAEAICITGNLKFDALAPGNQNHREHATLVAFGSTRPGDEEPILDAIVRLRKEVPGTRFVLAPRHLNRIPEIIRMIEDRKLEFELHSRLDEKTQPAGFILLDKMGELDKYYAQSCLAFVGGGFDPDFGGQNILEPAAYCQPVIFGRHMGNFAEEARLLSTSGGGIQIDGPEDIYPEILRLLIQPEERRRLGKLAGETVKNNRGATQRNVELIEKFLRETKRR